MSNRKNSQKLWTIQQPKVYHVDFLSGPKFVAYTTNSFKEGMTKLGHVEGQNSVYDFQATGFGIPVADLPFIFDRFYRVRHGKNSEVEGNGLGLAIVKSIIEGHGGQVSVQSEPGKSSSFKVCLPILYLPESPAASEESKSKSL